MERKENQRVMLTKRLLKESLIRLMSGKEIQKISVSELCRDAGINRATFYNHYNTPYDLLRDIEKTMVKEARDIWNGSSINESKMLNQRIAAICRYFQDNQDIARLIFQNNTAKSNFSSELFRVEYPWNELFSKAYGEAGCTILMTFISSGAYDAIQQWLLEDNPKTPEEMGEMLSETIFHGISGINESLKDVHESSGFKW